MIHLLMDNGVSRCGHVSTKPGWNRRGYHRTGGLSSDLDTVTCKLCLYYATGCNHRPNAATDRADTSAGSFGEVS